MKILVVDTCIWVNVATHAKLWPVLDRLEAVLRSGNGALLLPSIIHDEVRKHLPTTAESGLRSLRGQVKSVKSATKLLGDRQLEIEAKGCLDRVLQTLANDQTQIKDIADQIFALLDGPHVRKVDATTPEIESAALRRALAKRGPCHNSKNNIADALIVECTLAAGRTLGAGESLTLVSDNTTDFSDPQDNRLFHPDLLADFSSIEVEYSRNLAATIDMLSTEPAAEDLVIAFDDLVNSNEAARCSNCRGETYGHWRMSQYGGGLSWHHTCPSCGWSLDTGDFFE